MAASLIESMTVDFDPDEFHDNYREALAELVNAKVEGREVVQPESPGEAAEPTSLADALKASLAAARGSGTGNGGAKENEDSAEESGSRRQRTSTGRSRAASAKEAASEDGQPAAKGEAAAKGSRTRRRAS